MTRLEIYLDEGRRSRARHAVWLAGGVSQADRARLYKQEFGFAERAARQRWDVIDFLRRHNLQGSGLGDVDPSKLRELVGKSIAGSNTERVEFIKQHCSQSMTKVQEQCRHRADVLPSSVIAAYVCHGGSGWSVGVATERKKGQLLVRDLHGLDSRIEAVGVAIGSALMVGRLELTFEGSLDLREQTTIREKLNGLCIDVRICTQSSADTADLGSRWPRFDEVARGPAARLAAGHLLAVLEGRGTATLDEPNRPQVTKEVPATERANGAKSRAARK